MVKKQIGVCHVKALLMLELQLHRTCGIRTKSDKCASPIYIGTQSSPEMFLDESTNWIVTPLNIWHKHFKDPKFERNARLLRRVAFDTDFTPTELDSRFKHRANLGITSYCQVSSM